MGGDTCSSPRGWADVLADLGALAAGNAHVDAGVILPSFSRRQAGVAAQLVLEGINALYTAAVCEPKRLEGRVGMANSPRMKYQLIFNF